MVDKQKKKKNPKDKSINELYIQECSILNILQGFFFFNKHKNNIFLIIYPFTNCYMPFSAIFKLEVWYCWIVDLGSMKGYQMPILKITL